MTAVLNTSSNKAQSALSNDDLATLRALLLGAEYEDVLQQKNTLKDPELLAQHIAPVITQVLKLRSESDDSISHALAPMLEKSLTTATSANPQPIADALYPVMGPAIRKSISVNLTQMTNSMNELLDNSLSPSSFRWRFDAWRTGKSYAEVVLMNKLEYQVEQVFLIHNETGLLLQHVVSDTAISKDPDVVSGMLTAIQDFLRDSFETENNSDLDTLKLGDLTVLIEHSPTAVLAAVVRGTVPSNLRQMLSVSMEHIHSKEHEKIKNYNGDSSQFEHLQAPLDDCLTKQSRTIEKVAKPATGPSKKKALFLAIGLCALTGLAYLTYTNYSNNQQWDELQQAFRTEPGIILSHSSYEDGTYQLHGLADSMAKAPASIIDAHNKNKLSIETNFTPYLSLAPTFILQRIEKALQPAATVVLTLNDEVLYVTGTADDTWVDKLKLHATLFAGVHTINLDELKTTSTQ